MELFHQDEAPNFDSENRLRELSESGVGTIGVYDYEAGGYRVRTQANGNETYFIRDESGQVLSEFQRPVGGDGDPIWNKDYVNLFGRPFALVKNDIPVAPQRPWATPVTSTTATLHWNASAEPDLLGYSIERHYKKTAESAEVVSTVSLGGGVTSWSDVFANPKGTASLRYFLLVMDAAGNLSEASPALFVYPGTSGPPVVPAWIQATPGDRQVHLEWSDAAPVHDDLWGYYIDRFHGGTTWDQLNSTPQQTTHYADTDRANNAQYCYRVRAVDTAGRISSPSAQACATPMDIYPPAKVFGVTAEAGLQAGAVTVRWPASTEADIVNYKVYHKQGGGSWMTGTPVASDGSSAYVVTLSGLPDGLNDFAVTAVDGALPNPNESEKSDAVQARPRVAAAVLAAPTLATATLSVNESGTPASADCSAPLDTCCEVSAESDDVIQVALSWSAVSGATGYRVYRKSGAETRYRPMTTSSGTTYVDTAVTSGSNVYYVVALNATDESAASNQLTASDSFPSDPASSPSVRNLKVKDGRSEFRTNNGQSRAAFLYWSRVVEADLVGYNVYRRCDPGGCLENALYPSMEHFACDPVWERLNLAPITPDRRLYVDSDLGGMGGCFEYLVRPVGPNSVEGRVSKVIVAQLGLDMTADDKYEHYHCKAASQIHQDDASTTLLDASAFLNATTAPKGINQIPRGTGTAAGNPPVPTNVTLQMVSKSAPMDINLGVATSMAKVFWSMPGDPSGVVSDLAGFRVDVAHSPTGPWSRASHGLVAWWERHYTLQGAAIEFGASDQGDCLSFRVVAVDESGLESSPSNVVTYNPHGLSCSQTPGAPYELKATTHATHFVDNEVRNEVKLVWKGVAGATQYSIYRLIMLANHTFFYETQRQAAVGGGGDTQTYIEQGDFQDVTASDLYQRCYFTQVIGQGPWRYCAVKSLEAYFVTARGSSGGESQRSNVVFWDSTDALPYARLDRSTDPDVMLASLVDEGLGSEQVCSLEPLRSAMRDDKAIDVNFCPSPASYPSLAPNTLQFETSGPVLVARSSAREAVPRPMVSLGALPDPPWQVINLHTDHLGTVRAETAVATGAVSLHDYLPFGQMIDYQYSSNTHEFTGHERDHESGLDYMRARYYGAFVGRFRSVDKGQPLLVNPTSWNRYSYAENNPINRFDPDGLAAVGIRGLDLFWGALLGLPMPPALFHVQGFYFDAAAGRMKDVGWFNSGGGYGMPRPDARSNFDYYVLLLNGLDDQAFADAVSIASREWRRSGSPYELCKADCQRFMENVLDWYDFLTGEDALPKYLRALELWSNGAIFGEGYDSIIVVAPQPRNLMNQPNWNSGTIGPVPYNTIPGSMWHVGVKINGVPQD